VTRQAWGPGVSWPSAISTPSFFSGNISDAATLVPIRATMTAS
jgi:hypothetical protein